jgi:hypothetical protein
MSGARELDAPRLVCSSRCECGNSVERGGIYPCDSEGRQLASSDLVYCDRCDKITVRKTGRLFGYRSLLASACTG